MLKNIKNNVDLIRHEGEDIDWCAIAIAACEAEKGQHAILAAQYKQEYDDALAMETKFSDAIDKLSKNQTRLDEIKGEYQAFQNTINNAWTSAPDLKNYHTIGEDIQCLDDYSSAIGDAITDLTAKMAEWTSKKDTAWSNYQTENEAANVTCTC